jgi:hypothetical protein
MNEGWVRSVERIKRPNEPGLLREDDAEAHHIDGIVREVPVAAGVAAPVAETGFESSSNSLY